jgi:hypothetical protein
MCPACLTTAALLAAGASSSGGLTAFVIGMFRAKGGPMNADQQPKPELEPSNPTESYAATSGSLPVGNI